MKLSPNKYSYNKILTHTSRFPSLGIPRLDLEYPCWNTYVGHWNSYVGIPMSNAQSLKRKKSRSCKFYRSFVGKKVLSTINYNILDF